jgi:hypothetical protein
MRALALLALVAGSCAAAAAHDDDGTRLQLDHGAAAAGPLPAGASHLQRDATKAAPPPPAGPPSRLQHDANAASPPAGAASRLQRDASTALPPAGAILLNSSRLGRRFDGFGGLSGGGATSRLLQDYEAGPAGAVLDLLFKPFYGAALHGLKVEVGGDSFSGCGTEPSHMHNATDFSTRRGYEWSLMRGAAARNPSILGYALPWSFPHWIGANTSGNPLNAAARNPSILGFPHWIGANTSGNPLNAAAAGYMAAFCAGAAAGAGGGWVCDMVGSWNERSWTIDYTLQLRAALDAANQTAARLVLADDGDWGPAAAVLSNATFAAVVDVLGIHYPVGSNSSSLAIATGLPLWASEDSSTYFDAAGGACLSRILNWNYVWGSMTSLYVWNLLTSYLDHLFWWGDSLMGAAYPWAGSWQEASPLWAAAHLTQFAWPGWAYLPASQALPAGQGGSGLLPGGGTYVTLVDATGFSAVAAAAGEAAAAACAGGDAGGDAGASCAAARVAAVKAAHEDHFASGGAYREGAAAASAAAAFSASAAAAASSSSAAAAAASGGPLEWTIILETTTPAHSQCIRSNPHAPWAVVEEQNVTFVLDAGLALPPSVVVWKTVHFTSAGEPAVVWFQRQEALPVDAATRSFTLPRLHPDTTVTLTSMDRGQAHGTPPPPPPVTPFPSPYADDFASTPVEGMPRYFSDQTGSFAVMPRRDGVPGTAYEQVVVAAPVAWSGDSLFPVTILGDWNASLADVSVDAFIYSPSAYTPTGDPLVSLIPCDGGDAGQVWALNASADFALPGSLVDAQLRQCFDVFGCDPDPGTPVWMWPCVASAPGTPCSSTNQLWSVGGGGTLVSGMDGHLCVTALPAAAGGGWSIVMHPCGGAPAGGVQTFAYDGGAGLFRAGGAAAGLCLCSRPPPQPAGDATHAGIGLRLGGMTAASSVARAYSTTWFNYGYFFSVRPDGSWAIAAGPDAPGELSEAEVAARVAAGRGPRRSAAAAAAAPPPPPLRADPRVTLANGTLPAGAMGLQQWHTLRFTAAGATLCAYFDGAQLACVHDATFPVGWAALHSGWSITQFANFSMTSSA